MKYRDPPVLITHVLVTPALMAAHVLVTSVSIREHLSDALSTNIYIPKEGMKNE